MSVMSWDVREEVDYYVARAVSAAGEYQLCNSTNSVCSFPTLGCGETFTFTVTAHRSHCQSDASAPVYLTTGTALHSVQKSSDISSWGFNQKIIIIINDDDANNYY